MISDLGHKSSDRITVECEVEIIFRKDQFLDPVVNGGGIGWLVAFSPSNILSVVFDDWTPSLGGKMGFKHFPERRSSRLWIVKEEDLFIQMARKVFTPRARRNGGRFATAAQQSQAIERRASVRNGEAEAGASTMGSAQDPHVVPPATRAGAEREQF